MAYGRRRGGFTRSALSVEKGAGQRPAPFGSTLNFAMRCSDYSNSITGRTSIVPHWAPGMREAISTACSGLSACTL
jgi:hypothetical protein